MSRHLPLLTEIKGHSLDDGPGIRTVVFFKGCPLACVWCHNPETIDPRPQLRHQAERCLDQGACREACTHGALSGPPWRRDTTRCIGCGDCVSACTSGALTRVGYSLPVPQLLKQLLRYRPFFRHSGGGVTLSGGEATLYPAYCGELLSGLGAAGVHRLLETCGLFAWDRVARHMLPELEALYFDLKFIDESLHKRYCGQSNRQILANFERLLDWRDTTHELRPRIPLIPGLTDRPDNLLAIARFLQSHGIRRLSLLPYNPLWQDKARQLGARPRFGEQRWQSHSDIESARACFWQVDADFEVLPDNRATDHGSNGLVSARRA